MGLSLTRSLRKHRGDSTDYTQSIGKAIQWVKNHRVPGGGILPHNCHTVATQEVTGYFIPTLLQLGEVKLAKELARWEASIQRSDGAFEAPDGGAYTFDTAQVIRGFLSVLDEMPELEINLRRACDYVANNVTPEGKVTTPSYSTWECSDGTRFSEYTDLYVLHPLVEAGKRLSEPRYSEAAHRALAFFRGKPDLVEFKPNIGTLSHIFGYMMEGLAQVGEYALAQQGLKQAAAIQQSNGAIPAYPGASWICSTGIAQLALAWYRIGKSEPAEKAVNYLSQIQNESGGFYGSYGPNGQYFANEEISWAVKFYLDCHLVREGLRK